MRHACGHARISWSSVIFIRILIDTRKVYFTATNTKFNAFQFEFNKIEVKHSSVMYDCTFHLSFYNESFTTRAKIVLAAIISTYVLASTHI